MTREEWARETSDAERQAMANGRRRWQTTRRWRAKHRQAQLAKRLVELQREAMAAGMIRRLPWGAIEQLATEFGVSERTIRQDIKAIDRWPDPAPPQPRQRLRDPRFAWAYSRPRPTTLPKKVSCMLTEEQDAWLRAHADPPAALRRAIAHEMAREGQHYEDLLDEAALVIATACDFDTQDRLVRRAEKLKLPLAKVLAALLLVQSKREEG